VHRDAQQFDLRPGQVQRPSTGWEGVHVLQMRGWKVSNPPREPRLTNRLELVPAVPGLPTRQVPGQQRSLSVFVRSWLLTLCPFRMALDRRTTWHLHATRAQAACTNPKASRHHALLAPRRRSRSNRHKRTARWPPVHARAASLASLRSWVEKFAACARTVGAAEYNRTHHRPAA
jgi:hypothetical protein